MPSGNSNTGWNRPNMPGSINDAENSSLEALVAPALGSHSEALFALAREFGRGGVLAEIRAILARL